MIMQIKEQKSLGYLHKITKVEYLSCESHGYIRPIILVSKTQLEKYMKEKEKDEE